MRPRARSALNSVSNSRSSSSVACSRSAKTFRADFCARISSSSLSWIALPSRFWVAWMRKTIRKVTMVVPVLITSCQLSEKPNTGPLIAQELLQGTGLGAAQVRSGAEAHLEAGPPDGPLALKPAAGPLHASGKVRQPDGDPRRRHRERVRRVQAEEPDPRTVAGMRDVGPEIELVKIGERRQPAQAPVAERERGHRHPGAPLVLVDREPRGHLIAQLQRRHSPMQEEQIAPILVTDDHGARAWMRGVTSLAKAVSGVRSVGDMRRAKPTPAVM